MLIFLIGYAIVKIVQNAVAEKKAAKEQAVPAPSESEPATAPTTQALESLAYSVMCQKVNALVLKDRPGARWVWETPDTWSRLCRGDRLFILLNRAGGYRRAQVIVQNLQVTGLVYESATGKEDELDESPEPAADEVPDNYELLAFQWVDAHQSDLSARCSEARQQNLTELTLTENELPVPESWQEICKQLASVGYTETRCLAEGIKIILTGDEQNGDVSNESIQFQPPAAEAIRHSDEQEDTGGVEVRQQDPGDAERDGGQSSKRRVRVHERKRDRRGRSYRPQDRRGIQVQRRE